MVSALNEAAGPITIHEILELDTTLAQSSVYRNLTILEGVGAVSRIVTNHDHARVELAEALTDHHHHHLICTTCGSVTDFELSPATEATLDRAFKNVDKSGSFRIDGHRLDLLGTCGTCA
ncbi:MAG: transcriptional repressor [Ilumatobacter sp.]